MLPRGRWLDRYLLADVKIGNRGCTAALAVQAIEGVSRRCRSDLVPPGPRRVGRQAQRWLSAQSGFPSVSLNFFFPRSRCSPQDFALNERLLRQPNVLLLACSP